MVAAEPVNPPVHDQVENDRKIAIMLEIQDMSAQGFVFNMATKAYKRLPTPHELNQTQMTSRVAAYHRLMEQDSEDAEARKQANIPPSFRFVTDPRPDVDDDGNTKTTEEDEEELPDSQDLPPLDDLTPEYEEWEASKQFANTCLFAVLNQQGIPVQPRRDGPFWALRDGNEILQEYGKCLLRVDTNTCMELPPGRYIQWSSAKQGHFLSCVVSSGSVHHIHDGTNIAYFKVTEQEACVSNTNYIQDEDRLGGMDQDDRVDDALVYDGMLESLTFEVWLACIGVPLHAYYEGAHYMPDKPLGLTLELWLASVGLHRCIDALNTAGIEPQIVMSEAMQPVDYIRIGLSQRDANTICQRAWQISAFHKDALQTAPRDMVCHGVASLGTHLAACVRQCSECGKRTCDYCIMNNCKVCFAYVCGPECQNKHRCHFDDLLQIPADGRCIAPKCSSGTCLSSTDSMRRKKRNGMLQSYKRQKWYEAYQELKNDNPVIKLCDVLEPDPNNVSISKRAWQISCYRWKYYSIETCRCLLDADHLPLNGYRSEPMYVKKHGYWGHLRLELGRSPAYVPTPLPLVFNMPLLSEESLLLHQTAYGRLKCGVSHTARTRSDSAQAVKRSAIVSQWKNEEWYLEFKEILKRHAVLRLLSETEPNRRDSTLSKVAYDTVCFQWKASVVLACCYLVGRHRENTRLTWKCSPVFGLLDDKLLLLRTASGRGSGVLAYTPRVRSDSAEAVKRSTVRERWKNEEWYIEFKELVKTYEVLRLLNEMEPNPRDSTLSKRQWDTSCFRWKGSAIRACDNLVGRPHYNTALTWRSLPEYVGAHVRASHRLLSMCEPVTLHLPVAVDFNVTRHVNPCADEGIVKSPLHFGSEPVYTCASASSSMQLLYRPMPTEATFSTPKSVEDHILLDLHADGRRQARWRRRRYRMFSDLTDTTTSSVKHGRDVHDDNATDNIIVCDTDIATTAPGALKRGTPWYLRSDGKFMTASGKLNEPAMQKRKKARESIMASDWCMHLKQVSETDPSLLTLLDGGPDPADVTLSKRVFERELADWKRMLLDVFHGREHNPRQWWFRWELRALGCAQEAPISSGILKHCCSIAIALSHLYPETQERLYEFIKNSVHGPRRYSDFYQFLTENDLWFRLASDYDVEPREYGNKGDLWLGFPGRYIVHCQRPPNPCCHALRRYRTGAVDLYELNFKYSMSIPEIQALARKSKDSDALTVILVQQTRYSNWPKLDEEFYSLWAAGLDGYGLDHRVTRWLKHIGMAEYAPHLMQTTPLTWEQLDVSDLGGPPLTIETFVQRGIPYADAVYLAEKVWKGRLAISRTRYRSACGVCGKRNAFIDYMNRAGCRINSADALEMLCSDCVPNDHECLEPSDSSSAAIVSGPLEHTTSGSLGQALDGSTFLEQLDTCANGRAVETDGHLLRWGRCIPCSIAHMVPNVRMELVRMCLEYPDKQWTYAHFQEVLHRAGFAMSAHRGMPTLGQGLYIVHSNGSNSPHAIGISVSEHQECTVFDGNVSRSMRLAQLLRSYCTSVDRDSVVVIKLERQRVEIAEDERLLLRRAAAQGSLVLNATSMSGIRQENVQSCADQHFSNICLFAVLNQQGIPAHPSRDGPFWAIRDGNEALHEFGKCLCRVDTDVQKTLPPGRYIEWNNTKLGHFVDRTVAVGVSYYVGRDNSTAYFQVAERKPNTCHPDNNHQDDKLGGMDSSSDDSTELWLASLGLSHLTPDQVNSMASGSLGIGLSLWLESLGLHRCIESMTQAGMTYNIVKSEIMRPMDYQRIGLSLLDANMICQRAWQIETFTRDAIQLAPHKRCVDCRRLVADKWQCAVCDEWLCDDCILECVLCECISCYKHACQNNSGCSASSRDNQLDELLAREHLARNAAGRRKGQSGPARTSRARSDDEQRERRAEVIHHYKTQEWYAVCLRLRPDNTQIALCDALEPDPSDTKVSKRSWDQSCYIWKYTTMESCRALLGDEHLPLNGYRSKPVYIGGHCRWNHMRTQYGESPSYIPIPSPIRFDILPLLDDMLMLHRTATGGLHLRRTDAYKQSRHVTKNMIATCDRMHCCVRDLVVMRKLVLQQYKDQGWHSEYVDLVDEYSRTLAWAAMEHAPYDIDLSIMTWDQCCGNWRCNVIDAVRGIRGGMNSPSRTRTLLDLHANGRRKYKHDPDCRPPRSIEPKRQRREHVPPHQRNEVAAKRLHAVDKLELSERKTSLRYLLQAHPDPTDPTLSKRTFNYRLSAWKHKLLLDCHGHGPPRRQKRDHAPPTPAQGGSAFNTYGSCGPFEGVTWRSTELKLYLYTGVPWRASAPVTGPLGDLAKWVTRKLHSEFDWELHEYKDDGQWKPVTRQIPPHIELINPSLATRYPHPLTAEEIRTRTEMQLLIQRCELSHVEWMSGWGTGRNTTAVLALWFQGLPHACRGIHMTVAAMRVATASSDDQEAIRARTEALIEQWYRWEVEKLRARSRNEDNWPDPDGRPPSSEEPKRQRRDQAPPSTALLDLHASGRGKCNHYYSRLVQSSRTADEEAAKRLYVVDKFRNADWYCHLVELSERKPSLRYLLHAHPDPTDRTLTKRTFDYLMYAWKHKSVDIMTGIPHCPMRLALRAAVRTLGNATHASVDETISKFGRCIPFALGHLVPECLDSLVELLNTTWYKSFYYTDFQHVLQRAGKWCYVKDGLIELMPGSYILHSDGFNNSYCHALTVDGTQYVRLYDKTHMYYITELKLRELIAEALDGTTVKTIKVCDATKTALPWSDELSRLHACGDENYELDPRVAMWLRYIDMDVYKSNMAMDPALTWAFLDQSAWLEHDDENQQLTVEYFENRGIPRHDAVTLSENAYKNRLSLLRTRYERVCGSCGQRRAFIDYMDRQGNLLDSSGAVEMLCDGCIVPNINDNRPNENNSEAAGMQWDDCVFPSSNNNQQFPVLHADGTALQQCEALFSFNQLIDSVVPPMPAQMDRELTTWGNCIPCSIAHLVPDLKDTLARLCKSQPKTRWTYADFSCHLSSVGLAMQPESGLAIGQPGMYIVHSGGINTPHAIGVVVSADGGCVVYDGDTYRLIDVSLLSMCFSAALDSSSIVTIMLGTNNALSDISSHAIQSGSRINTNIYAAGRPAGSRAQALNMLITSAAMCSLCTVSGVDTFMWRIKTTQMDWSRTKQMDVIQPRGTELIYDASDYAGISMNSIDDVLDELNSSVPIKLMQANVDIYTNGSAHGLPIKARVYTVQRIDEQRAHREPTAALMLGVSETNARVDNLNSSGSGPVDDYASSRMMYSVVQAMSLNDCGPSKWMCMSTVADLSFTQPSLARALTCHQCGWIQRRIGQQETIEGACRNQMWVDGGLAASVHTYYMSRQMTSYWSRCCTRMVTRLMRFMFDLSQYLYSMVQCHTSTQGCSACGVAIYNAIIVITTMPTLVLCMLTATLCTVDLVCRCWAWRLVSLNVSRCWSNLIAQIVGNVMHGVSEISTTVLSLMDGFEGGTAGRFAFSSYGNYSHLVAGWEVITVYILRSLLHITICMSETVRWWTYNQRTSKRLRKMLSIVRRIHKQRCHTQAWSVGACARSTCVGICARIAFAYLLVINFYKHTMLRCMKLLLWFVDITNIPLVYEYHIGRIAFRLMRPASLIAISQMLTVSNMFVGILYVLTAIHTCWASSVVMKYTAVASSALVVAVYTGCTVQTLCATAVLFATFTDALHARKGTVCTLVSVICMVVITMQYGECICALSATLSTSYPCFPELADSQPDMDNILLGSQPVDMENMLPPTQPGAIDEFPEVDARFADDDDAITCHGDTQASQNGSVNGDGVTLTQMMDDGIPGIDGASSPPPKKKARMLKKKLSMDSQADDNIDDLLETCENLCATDKANMVPDVIPDEMGVLDNLTESYGLIERLHPQWPPYLKDIAVAAIALHDLRYSEISVIEQVILLYLGEGCHRIRSHDGTAYNYRNGGWVAFSGLFGQGTIKRLRRFCKILEGLFRSMPREKDLPKNKEDLLEKVQSVFCELKRTDFPNDTIVKSKDSIIAKLMQKAHNPKPKGKGKGKGSKSTSDSMTSVQADTMTSVDACDYESFSWNESLSFHMSTISSNLTRDLLNKTVLPYFIEWCETPLIKTESFCTADQHYSFTPEGPPYAKTKRKTPTNNCYLYLTHKLTSDISLETRTRMKRFYKQTFWNNLQLLKVQYAMCLLALAGRNVDRAWWSVGPGGVGQSLNSWHTAKVFQSYHCYLDMNILFDDTEFRKQGDQNVQKIVFTGQETVQGAKKKMREDLYKKLMSADPIAVRLPYAIVTKMVEFKGWKRFEMNQLMNFSEVTEENFDSIMRRSCVGHFKGRFVTERKMAEFGGEAAAAVHGIFERDTDLKRFLGSDEAINYTMELLIGFAKRYSLKACEQIIEDYVDGTDGGLTRRCMRQACGLGKPGEDNLKRALARGASVAGDGATSVPQTPSILPKTDGNSQTPLDVGRVPNADNSAAAFRQNTDMDPAEAQQRRYIKDSEQLMKCLLNAGRDYGSHDCKSEHIWDKGNTRQLSENRFSGFDGLLAKLERMGLWRPVGRRHKITKASMPLVHGSKCMPDFGWWKQSDPAKEFPESYNSGSFLTYVNSDPNRAANLKTVVRSIEAAIPKRSSRGRPSSDEVKKSKTLTDQKIKYLNLIGVIAKLMKLIHNNEVTKIISTYAYKTVWPSRRYLVGLGAQMMTGRLLNELIPETTDVDVVNAMYTIVIQLVDAIAPFNFVDPELQDLATFSSWRKCAVDRAAVLAMIYDRLGEGVDAKELLVSIGNGAALPEPLMSEDFFVRLKKESILLRWIACTQMPETYKEIQEKGKSEWPEATTFFIWWTGAEDAILDSMVEKIRIVGDRIKHLSLHFDGFRLDTPTYAFMSDAATPNENWLEALQDAVKEDIGFSITLKVKKPKDFFEQVFADGTEDESRVVVPEEFTLDGMCIPCSVGVLAGDFISVRECLNNLSTPYDYKAFARFNKQTTDQSEAVCLKPSLGLNVSQPGSYIIHSECRGKPHAIAAKVQEDKWVHLQDGNKFCSTTLSDLYSMYSASSDRSTVVTFLYDAACATVLDEQASVLLELRASGKPKSMIGNFNYVKAVLANRKQQIVKQLRQTMKKKFPSDCLFELLAEEVRLYKEEMQPYKRMSLVCRLCPFNTKPHDRMLRLKSHVGRCHTATSWFILGKRRGKGVHTLGKQFKVCQAIYDNRVIKGRELLPDLLKESAKIIIESAPGVRYVTAHVDDHLSPIVLTNNGPVYLMKFETDANDFVRLSRNYYCDRKFAELVLRSFILAKGSSYDTLTRVYLHYVQRTQLAAMLPMRVITWQRFVAILWASRAVDRLRTQKMLEASSVNEWESISIDATYKLMLRVIGQSNYISKRTTREKQAIADKDAKYCLFTVRGRTGLVAGLQPMRYENSRTVQLALQDIFDESKLATIKHVASDDPSIALLQHLRAIMPALRGISKDPMHLFFYFKRRFKKSPKESFGYKATRDIKKICSKFCRRVNVRPVPFDKWFDGDNEAPKSQEEVDILGQIENESMAQSDAQQILERLNAQTPYSHRTEYMRALAAFVAVHGDACSKNSGREPLKTTVRNAACPKNCEWVFNFQHYLLSIPMSAYEYFPTGTCSNEALHREINQCISYKILRYETTIDQMIRGFHFAKVIAHAAAVFGTPTRQLKQGMLVQHSVGAMRFWTHAQWQHFCKRVNSHTYMGGPVNDEVKKQSIMRTKVKTNRAARGVSGAFLKTYFGVPASRCLKKTQVQMAVRPTKRTVFKPDTGRLEKFGRNMPTKCGSCRSMPGWIQCDKWSYSRQGHSMQRRCLKQFRWH